MPIGMLIAAAVCPHPPLLIPQATGAPGAGDPDLQRLRIACHQAISALLTERPGLIAVVGADPKAGHAAEYPPRTPGRLYDFGVPFTIGEDRGPASLPLSLTIGKWLLSPHAAARAAWWGSPRTHPPPTACSWGRSWPRSPPGWRCSPWATGPPAGPAPRRAA